jgi:peroxiredoxin
VALSDFLGQPVILAFYPADWSPVCTDQLSLYAEVMPEFKKHNAELLAISVDNIWSHLAFSKDRKLNFPVLADFEPKGIVSRKYGAFKENIGESARALFVIDDKGVIRWSHLSPDGVNPGADGILRALESLNQPVQTN